MAVLGGSLAASFTSGYVYRDTIRDEVYPPLDRNEKEVLMRLNGNPKALQEWIATGTLADDERFIGSLCPETAKSCEVWTPAVHYLRTKKGDCDDVMALAHYVLNKSGKVLFLGGNSPNHVVYVYPGENGLYGVISIGASEYSLPKYKTIDEVAQSFSGRYDYYREETLPDDDQILLYSFDLWERITRGPPKAIKANNGS